MKTLPLNKNSNFYTARFTDISFLPNHVVILYNYFTGQTIKIQDKKFYEKLDWYVYTSETSTINYNSNYKTWINQREFNKKYDRIEFN